MTDHLPACPLQAETYPEEARIASLQAWEQYWSWSAPSIPPPAQSESGTLQLPSSSPKLIGLCGLPQSGKDVVANYLRETYQQVSTLAFSDVILLEVNQAIQAIDRSRTLLHENNKSFPEHRQLLQAWGLGRRIEDPKYWTRKVKSKIYDAFEGASLVVVTGARVPVINSQVVLTDLELIWGLGGEIWLLKRSFNPYQAEHVVEEGLLSLPDELFQYIVTNDVEGDLEQVTKQVEQGIRTKQMSGV